MISKKMAEALKGGSEIRKMFEEGGRLKAIYGAENVYDFSIGNPDLEPPKEVFDALKDLANNPTPGMHGYMPNAGYPSTRQIVAEKRGKEAGMEIGADAVLEYNGYVANHGGKVVIVQTDDKFNPVIADIEKAITSKTKAIIVNSPNNPSGVVYPAELLIELNDMLKKQDHTIYVISDEPYIDLAYDGAEVPCALKYIDNLIICFSWSKSLSLPGERIGYTLVSPKCADFAELTGAIVLSNRTLGSVNAPAIWQKVIEKAIYAKVDVANYENRRNLLYANIVDAGFDAVKPNGALYIFMNTPKGLTDEEFAKICAKQNLLLVKGSSFARRSIHQEFQKSILRSCRGTGHKPQSRALIF